MGLMDAKCETKKYKICFLGCFLFGFFIYCQGSQKRDASQLMVLMMREIQLLHPEYRNPFIDLCINKGHKCSVEQFQGPNTIFLWRTGVSLLDKVHFWGTYTCVYRRQPSICPVNGGWTEWAQWTTCKAQCEDIGSQVRSRACENPKPRFGGHPCEGVKTNKRSCVGRCQANANGEDEAREYILQMHAKIPKLAVMCMKKHCVYEDIQEIIKDINKVDKYWSSIVCIKYSGPCPVNGGWGRWSAWSRCSLNCGYGEMFRRRRCNNPTTKNGGTYCKGSEYDIQRCLSRNRCLGGETFTEWSMFSPCSTSCGTYGVKNSIKTCLYPSNCRSNDFSPGNMVRIVPCYGGPCSQTGGWGVWGEWTSCSAKCGTGRKGRVRFCDQPPPTNGEECPGPNIDVGLCEGRHCIQLPGQERRRRSESGLDLPESGNISTKLQTSAPSYFYMMQVSILKVNEEDNASIISKSNKSGRVKLFHRLHQTESSPFLNKKMANDSSSSLDLRVVSDYKDDTVLLFEPYIVSRDNWYLGDSNWTHELKRNRGKRSSKPSKVDENDPFNFPFNVDLEFLYNSWSQWTQCSKTCGEGIRQRKRTCINKEFVCRGEVIPQQFCNVDPCPVAGGWSSWMNWSPCSVTCGWGRIVRYRTCDNPFPSFGGSCDGPSFQSQSCFKKRCFYLYWFTWMSWTYWTACSAACGGGFRKRYRVFAYFFFQGDYHVCNMAPCKVNGFWSAWGGWSKCSLPCGLGHTFRDRTCTEPAPVNGGNPCRGPGSEIQKCYGGPCMDEDDYGVLFRGTGFVQYQPKGITTGFLMVFMRFKITQESGTLFHQTNQCKSKGIRDCDVSILMSLAGANLHLEVKISATRPTKAMISETVLEINAWQDLFVTVAEGWIGMRVNDEDYVIEKFPTRLRHDINLDGDLTIGANRLKGDGFHGVIGVLRRNFKALLLFNMTRVGFTVPSASRNVEKVRLPLEVRHPNFKGRYYSHLLFDKSRYLNVLVVFQLTDINGMLLFNAGAGSNSSIDVILKEGAVQFCLNYDKRQLCRKAYELKTGEWYLLHVKAKRNQGQIRMNTGNAMQITYPTTYVYQPRGSLYVSGAGPLDWPIIVELTKNDIQLHGIIDTLSVNGLTVTYKMASLIDINGWVNTLGYSLADHVTEVYEHPGSNTVLRCGVSRKLKELHEIKIFWLQDMKRIISTVGIEITESESLDQIVSKIVLRGSRHTEGVYACILSSDGVLVNLHAFILMHYYAPLKKDTEAQMEWIFFIILVVLILVVGVPLVFYNCTKHYSFWDKFSWTRDYLGRSYRKFRKKKIKKAENTETEQQPLLQEEESGASEPISSVSETSDSSDEGQMLKPEVEQDQSTEMIPDPSAPEPDKQEQLSEMIPDSLTPEPDKQDQQAEVIPDSLTPEPVKQDQQGDAQTPPTLEIIISEPQTPIGLSSRNPSLPELTATEMPTNTDEGIDHHTEGKDDISSGFAGAQNAPFVGIVLPAFGLSSYSFGDEVNKHPLNPFSLYPSDPFCQPSAPAFIPCDEKCISNTNPDTVKHTDFIRNLRCFSRNIEPCNFNQNSPSAFINTDNKATDCTDRSCDAACKEPYTMNSKNNYEARQQKNVGFYNKSGTSYDLNVSPNEIETFGPQKHKEIMRESFQKDLSGYDLVFKSAGENKLSHRLHRDCGASSSQFFSEFALHNVEQPVHSRNICTIELLDMGNFRKNQKNNIESECKSSSQNLGLGENSFSTIQEKCKKLKSLVPHTDDICSRHTSSSQQNVKYECFISKKSAVSQEQQPRQSFFNDELANLSLVNMFQQSSNEIENKPAQKQEFSGNSNDGASFVASDIANFVAHKQLKQTIPVERAVKTKSISKTPGLCQDTSGHRTDLHGGHEHSKLRTKSPHGNILTAGASVLQPVEDNQEVDQLNITESGHQFHIKGGKITVKKVKQKPL